MKDRSKFFLIMIVAANIFILQSCLKDDITKTVIPSLSNNALLLSYIETNGNYINSNEMPSIVDVDELYNNLNKYLIIDVRTMEEYSTGHIPGAINVQNDSLIDFLNSKADTIQYPKIIIVSSTGQSSAYFTSLLRIYGLNNVYSLNFGMALWNRVFSGTWIEHAKDQEIAHHLAGSKPYPSNPNMKLPDIQIDLQDRSIKDKIKNRIANIIKDGFDSQALVILSLPDTTLDNGRQIINFYFSSEPISDFYTINITPPQPSGSLPGSYFYEIKDFKSSSNIQTIPPDKKIVIYSVSGQISAFVTAYLRVLGYNAKSLLYGENGYINSWMTSAPEILIIFKPYVFLTEGIRNYPYVTGLSPK